jgi:hypothetical protein
MVSSHKTSVSLGLGAVAVNRVRVPLPGPSRPGLRREGGGGGEVAAGRDAGDPSQGCWGGGDDLGAGWAGFRGAPRVFGAPSDKWFWPSSFSGRLAAFWQGRTQTVLAVRELGPPAAFLGGAPQNGESPVRFVLAVHRLWDAVPRLWTARWKRVAPSCFWGRLDRNGRGRRENEERRPQTFFAVPKTVGAPPKRGKPPPVFGGSSQNGGGSQQNARSPAESEGAVP